MRASASNAGLKSPITKVARLRSYRFVKPYTSAGETFAAVPTYLLITEYGLFVIGVLACLFYVAKNFEEDDPN